MSVAIPFTFVGGPGQKARAAEVNANFQALAAKFTEGAGGIKNEDISSSCAMNGSKISNVPGSRIPFDRIEDDAITADKLKNDLSAGAPNAAVALASHIKDAIIPNAKLVAKTIAKDKINTVEVTQAFSFGASGGPTVVTVAIGTTPALPALAGIMTQDITFDTISFSGGATGFAYVDIGYTQAGSPVFLFTVGVSAACTISGTLRLTYVPATT